MEILVLLAADEDHTIGEAAQKTLQGTKAEELLPVLSSAETPAAVLEFAANHLIFGRKDIAGALLANTALAPALRDWINQAIAFEQEAAVAAASEPPPAPTAAPATEIAPTGEEKRERITLLQRVARMTSAEKIKAALTGNQEERLLLIRDSNKVVSRAVLQSPKISDMEIENIASMKNVTEEVLRLIAMNRKFAKSYNVVRALINNPRLPIDVGLPLLNRLNERDLKGLGLNKNVAEVIRGMAVKIIKMKEEATKPKLPGKKH
ncbi:MAG: hypothetical protein HY508_02915 [Acidobacteria bacterium]|nr:hypothetical protein [Acidobacteriota bacterium]